MFFINKNQFKFNSFFHHKKNLKIIENYVIFLCKTIENYVNMHYNIYCIIGLVGGQDACFDNFVIAYCLTAPAEGAFFMPLGAKNFKPLKTKRGILKKEGN